MAGYGVTAFLLAVAVNLHGSIAAQLASEIPVVRREAHSVVLSAHGEMIQEGEKDAPPTDAAPVTAVHTDVDPATPAAAATSPDTPAATTKDTAALADDADADTQIDKLCNTDLFLGEKNNPTCPGGAGQLLLDQASCVEAARESGAMYQDSDDDQHSGIPQDEQNKHPKGCFKLEPDHTSNLKACPLSAGEAGCYYYNGINSLAADAAVTGQIVCARPKHRHGALNSNGGCPDGYEVIQNATTCLESAQCFSKVDLHIKFVVGEKLRTDFDLGERKSWDQHPRWCFFIQEKGINGKIVTKAHYNVASPAAAGANVTGTNLCKVVTAEAKAAAEAEKILASEAKAAAEATEASEAKAATEAKAAQANR